MTLPPLLPADKIATARALKEAPNWSFFCVRDIDPRGRNQIVFRCGEVEQTAAELLEHQPELLAAIVVTRGMHKQHHNNIFFCYYIAHNRYMYF